MNIKKIIKESIDEFDWIRDTEPVIILEPNTMYYFEPELKPDEIELFANNITNSDYMRQWLLGRIQNILDNHDEGIKYFVTNYSLNGINGWCTEYPINQAKLMYSDSNIVDARKKFNL